MVIRVSIIGPIKSVKEVEGSKMKVSELLKKLGLLSSEYVVLKNNVIVSEDDIVNEGDNIIVYPVKSGG